jgi:FHS family L-fucose permease-like MFS transporter
MALAGTSVSSIKTDETSGRSDYLIPLILVTSLFFLWGMAYGLLDSLNKHFQDTLNVTKSRSTLLQAAYFGAYFCVALPAGIFMNKYGYKKGIIAGLILYAIGAFLFYPAAEAMNFNFFVIALFILASGLTCLETAANPYVTVLGRPETSTFRLNLSQCFNGVGAFLGPLVASKLFFGGENEVQSDLGNVQIVYIVIAGIVLLIAGLFVRTPLPEIKESELVSAESLDRKPIIKHGNLVYGVIAQFFYVAAQVGIAALFINYCTESGNNIDNEHAAELLSISLMLFTIGRFAGTALMKKIAPNKLLSIYAVINVFLCIAVAFVHDKVSIFLLMATFFFQSIMFPTIFALSVKDLGHHTKKGSSLLIMSIVGGACMPFVMGLVAERYSTAISYLVPMLCFINVAWYGWKGYKVRS